MGFFYDTCNALIDKNTGRALSGEALVAARKDPNWAVGGVVRSAADIQMRRNIA